MIYIKYKDNQADFEENENVENGEEKKSVLSEDLRKKFTKFMKTKYSKGTFKIKKKQEEEIKRNPKNRSKSACDKPTDLDLYFNQEVSTSVTKKYQAKNYEE